MIFALLFKYSPNPSIIWSVNTLGLADASLKSTNLQTSASGTNVTATLASYIDEAGSDLNIWEPSDLQEFPAFLDTIKDPEYKQWGSDLNQLWKLLGRQAYGSIWPRCEWLRQRMCRPGIWNI